MNQTSKRILLMVLGVIISLHFFLISVYCSPLNFNTSKLKVISYMYVYPVFHQNWCLFVPAPTADNRLYVRYQTNNGFSDWQDILGIEINKHKQNRLAGHEPIYLLMSNSLIYEFGPLSEKGSGVITKTPTDDSFKVLHFEVSQYLKLNFKVKSKTPCEMLLVSSSKLYTDAYYIKSLVVN